MSDPLNAILDAKASLPSLIELDSIDVPQGRQGNYTATVLDRLTGRTETVQIDRLATAAEVQAAIGGAVVALTGRRGPGPARRPARRATARTGR